MQNNQASEKINELTLKIAQRFEELGDQQTQGLLRIHFFEQSQKEYQKINDTKKINELNEKIRSSHDLIEWTEIKHEFKLPKVTIPGSNGFAKVMSIANSVDMIPNIAQTEQLANELQEKYPISSLFPSTTFNRRQPTGHHQTDEEIKESKIKQQFIQNIRLAETILSSSVEKLEKDNEIKSEDYFEYIKSFGLHDETALTIIKNGIDRHMQQDYISSIHILIPQVEYTLRELLRTKGIETTQNQENIITNVMLGALINRSNEVLGDDLSNYLKIKFVDIDGMNQRNNVSHADTHISEYTHSTSLSLIYVIMVITKSAVKS